MKAKQKVNDEEEGGNAVLPPPWHGSTARVSEPIHTRNDDEPDVLSTTHPGAIAIGQDGAWVDRIAIPIDEEDESIVDHSPSQPEHTLVRARQVAPEQDLEDRMAQRMHDTIAAQVQQKLHQQRQEEGVVLASPVSEDFAKEGEGGAIETPWYDKKWIRISGLIFLLAAVVVGVLVGVIVGTSDGGEDHTTSSPTTAPIAPTTSSATTQASTVPVQTAAFYALKEAMAYILGPTYNLTVFDDDSSVQYKALDWMANVDPHYSAGYLAEAPDEVLVERFVVVLIYFALGGRDWTYPLRFLSPSAICGWHDYGAVDRDGAATERGVFCNADNRVIQLDLTSNGVNGQMPDEVAYLSSLQVLEMSFNPGHHGKLPESITHLEFLETCTFRNNSLTGSIHTEFGAMSHLVTLDLGLNELTGFIPTEIGQASNLVNLLLFNNPHMGGTIPSEIGNLSNLYWLGLDGIGLTGVIPSELGSIGDALDILFLPDNRLEGPLPSELGRLIGLRRFALQDNPFLNGTVPVEYADMVLLTHVTLYGTALTGSLDHVWCDQSNVGDTIIAADCAGEVPEIECNCCQYCCMGGIETCHETNS